MDYGAEEERIRGAVLIRVATQVIVQHSRSQAVVYRPSGLEMVPVVSLEAV